MFTANQIADWFISHNDVDSGDTLSHLKLQKLVYYTQAWHYTIYGEPAFNERVNAWKTGPVIGSVYDRFINIPSYQTILIADMIAETADFSDHTLSVLYEVKDIYGAYSASYLEDLTHKEDPWIIARGGLPGYANCEQEITLDSMKEFYSKKLNEK